MNFLKTTAVVKVLLFALILIGMSSKSTTSNLCADDGYFSGCTLRDVSISTDSDATNFVFPDERGIKFKNPNISSSAKLLFSRIPEVVEELQIVDGLVPKVYIKHSLHDFEAYSCKLQEVIIDPTGTYKLTELRIHDSRLGAVPENIGKLTNLTKLDLQWNHIKTVSMNHFTDLTNLKVLELSFNSIVRVDTTVPLNLPNLEYLGLSRNKLQNLSITFWDFPALHYFDLKSNKLHSIINFRKQFPQLNTTYIQSNQWSCAWLESGKSETIKFKHDRDESCPEKSVDNICCQDHSIDGNSFNSFNERLFFALLQMIQLIEKKIARLAIDLEVLVNNKMIIMDRTVQEIREDVNLTQSSIREQITQIIVRIEENRASIADDRKQYQKGIDQIGENISNLTTDTRVLINDQIGDVNRTITGIHEEVKSIESSVMKQVEELQNINANDRKQFQQTSSNLQKEIDQIGPNISKLTTDTRDLIDNKMSDMGRTVQGIKEEVKSIESSIRNDLTQLNGRVESNRASIVDDQKLFQKRIAQIGESISNLTINTKVLINNKIGGVSRTIQGIQDEVKSIESSIRKELTQIKARVDENQASITDDKQQIQQARENLQKGIDQIDEKISQLTTDTKDLMNNKTSDVVRITQEINEELNLTDSSVREQNLELQKLTAKVDENRASIVDNRNFLEETINNTDNQMKDEFKRVKLNLKENRSLIIRVATICFIGSLIVLINVLICKIFL